MSSANQDKTSCRSGFVCLAGPTNAGKSTLMNAIIGEKVAIITAKPQTTRNRILGIHTLPGLGQILFVDTPGLHHPRSKLGQRMIEIAIRSIYDTDLVLLVVDVTRDVDHTDGLAPANQQAAQQVKSTGVPAMVALNKVDAVRQKAVILPVIQAYADLLGPVVIHPVSALRGDGLSELVRDLWTNLPEGPPLYPEDLLSDQAERFLAAEIIREKVIVATRQEIPYSVAVEVESFKEPAAPGQALRISAVVHVERKSQKGIVIGKGGSLLKKIGTAARQELESVFASKVFLELFVRVDKNWSEDPRCLDRFGYK